MAVTANSFLHSSMEDVFRSSKSRIIHREKLPKSGIAQKGRISVGTGPPYRSLVFVQFSLLLFLGSEFGRNGPDLI